MSEKLNTLLEKLTKWDRESAELIALAIAYGGTEEPVLEKMLVRRVEDYLESDDCCGCYTEEVDLTPLFTPDEDDGCDCPDCRDKPKYPDDKDPGFDDEYANDYNPNEDDDSYDMNGIDEDDDEDYYEEEDEEPVDELSLRLGVDVKNQTPIGLATAVVMTAGTDELQQAKLIQELGKRGRNIAQLTTLVEGLQ